MASTKNISFTEAELEALFKRHFSPLCVYCQYKFGIDLDVVKDIVHASFIRLWENREQIEPGLSVKAYLYKIVSNRSLDVLKHEKMKLQASKQLIRNAPGHAPVKTFDDVEIKQLMADIDEAVKELPAQMRRIFELSRYEGLKYAEIAVHLNLSVKTVETQMSRALVKLRSSLAGYLTLLSIIFLKYMTDFFC